MERPAFEYWYKAVMVSVYDGDTITVDVDMGFDLWHRKMKLRLHGIDTPELRGEEREAGLAVRDHVRELLAPGTAITINTYKDRTGKYGRYLARVFLADGTCINDYLLDQGMAEEY